MIQMYNTLTRKKEVFSPIDTKNVGMYVCGPTVYDRAHLGNAKTSVVFDVWYRLLMHIFGPDHVTYVSNITDVDDKILKKAKDTGKSIAEVTEITCGWYLDDMEKLNVLSPNFRPKATEFIPDMIALVELIIKNGHAYEAEGHILFDVDSMKNYGFLSGRTQKELLAGARIDIAEYKKNPADFVLWKPASPDEQGWDSPFGYGRPGWHLECSAMSAKHLGNSFDIHGGGNDLIFPHHENECAQSCCAHPSDSYAKYWLHAGMLMVDGVKMSKSLGNFYTVIDILEKFPAEALRLTFLSTHYHQPFNFTFENLENSKATLDKFYNALNKNSDVDITKKICDQRVIDALSDDLNTPLAMSYLHEISSNLNKAKTLADKQKYKSLLLGSAEILGLLYNNPQTWFMGNDDTTEIEAKITQRNEAKAAKNWTVADQIRNELKAMGIILEDGANGTSWKKS